MTAVYWKTAQSGSWETAADWTMRQVPGLADKAIISAAGSYTVDVVDPVSIAALRLSGVGATLADSSVLYVGSLTLTHGFLEMDNGILYADVTDTGAPVLLNGNCTWDDVTWHGNLKAGNLTPGSTLTLVNGFTLTRPSGSLPGTATIGSTVVLDNVSELDNASLTIKNGLSVSGSTALTLGSGLTLDANVSAAELTNNGSLQGNVTAKGGYVNNGQQTFPGPTTFGAPSNSRITAPYFINNGTLTTTGVLDIFGTTLPGGPNSVIHLSGVLAFSGDYTTARFEHLIESQHIQATGAFGISLFGTINNLGATLKIGAGTALGELGQVNGVATLIEGGVVSMHGTSPQLYASVSGATIDPHGAFLEVGDNTFSGDILNRVQILDVYDPTEPNFGPVTFTLNGTNFAAGPATIDVATDNGLVLGAAQDATGLTIHLADYSTLNAQAAGPLECAVHANGNDVHLGSLSLGSSGILNLAVKSDAFVNLESSAGQVIVTGSLYDSSATLNSGQFTIGKGAQAYLNGGQNDGSIVVGSAGYLYTYDIGGSAGSVFTNNGTMSLGAGSIVEASQGIYAARFINAGSISIGQGATLLADQLSNSGAIKVDGGLLEIDPSAFTNSGSITFENGGKLVLDGTLTLQSLTQFTSFSAPELIAGFLTLSSNETFDVNGSQPNLVLDGGAISGGNVVIEAGQTFLAAGGNIVSSLTNNGTILVSADEKSASGSTQLDLGAVAGNGTIVLSNLGVGELILNLGMPVGPGQTIDFATGSAAIYLDNSAQQHFSGTIEGFAVGDQVALKGDVTSASFQDHSITATLSNGSIITLATTSALTGSLSVHYFTGPNQSVLTYEPVGAALNDFANPGLWEPDAGGPSHASAGSAAWFDPHAHDLGWTAAWHGHVV